MKNKEPKINQTAAVSLLRDELTDVVRTIVEETNAAEPERERLEKIRKNALHLKTLLEEHLTDERIRILDVVQPLWVPDGHGDDAESAPPLPVDPLAGTIMVIDDEPSLSDPLVQQLKRDGYECVQFTDGESALGYLNAHPCMIVLLDVLMPGMNGREVLERIKSSADYGDTPVIMTAQRHELDHIAGSIHEGAEDFLAKPYNPTIVRARVASSIQRRQLRELEQRTFQALVKSQRQLAGELAEAAEYVTSLLPEKLTSPVATDWKYIPSSQLGGDSFGYHWIDEDHLAFYLLDVCGHGVGAALLSVSVLNFLRSGALHGQEARDPSLVLGRLNSTFQMEGHNDMYFSVWYGVYNARSRELDYCSGGHPPALLCSPGHPVQALSSGGTVIGALSYSQYRTGRAVVPSGSQLYLFSDGAYEIARPDADMMSHQEFADLVGTIKGPERIEAILDIIRKQHVSKEFDDDFSLMEFRFSEAPPSPPSSISLRNSMEELPRLLRFTESFSSTHGIAREDMIDVDVILEEMVTNVFKYGGIPAGSDACTIEVLLRGTFMDITIEDTGKPFNPLLLPEVDTAKNIEDRPIGGLGIHFVKKLTDSQYYEHRDGKNVLKLTKGLRS
jgi:sigma-B regulation protein RsbU (phosphoserine phosphatase)